MFWTIALGKKLKIWNLLSLSITSLGTTINTAVSSSNNIQDINLKT